SLVKLRLTTTSAGGYDDLDNVVNSNYIGRYTAMDAEAIRSMVRKRYGERARKAGEGAGAAAGADAGAGQGGGCCGTTSACCGGSGSIVELSQVLGYSEADLAAAPEGSNLGLGCGNPNAIADLKPGETVLDLGSGAGFDCFLAA